MRILVGAPRNVRGLFVLILAISAPLIQGCHPDPSHSTVTPAKTAPASPRTVSEKIDPHSTQSTTYQEATRLYARKDYASALKLIDQLLADTSISAQRREFLMRQRELCLHPLEAGSQKRQARSLPSIPPQARGGSEGPADCGPRALQIVLQKAGKTANVTDLTRIAGTNRYGTTLAGLEKAVKAAGLKAEAVQMDLTALKQMPGMGIAWVDGDHYVSVLSISGDEARIHDPNHENDETIPTETLLRRSGGIVLMVSK